ncbi:DUF1771-domain-containing protein [Artomyces pyxidatus]|uniref:DUF1771-domain-containing protein n=1 Tax=Artomyces pyxidatus TaxID=48021 RepID=A0ACB8T6M6_9AGAM|nr:DUF1771-domain-containing protein [Artomyces pyxidatus]
MGILGDIIRVLAKAFCGSSSADEGPPAQGQGYSGQPTYAQQAQQQPSYYPPQQQQQQPVYQPPQQPPHPHKPHHGHGNGQHAGSQPSSSPTSPSHGSPHGNGRDQNQINQANEHYVSLRARANAEGDAMARAFDESHAAYERKDGARAKELSNEGKAHQREMERLNGEASEWIFRGASLHTDSKPGEIDLHGLYVKEAIAYSDRSIQEALQRGDSEIHLIVGKGLHSPHGAAKLKPAIEDLIRKHNLVAALDPQNAGVLIVQLAGGSGAERARDRGGVMLGADEITQRLGGQDEGCIVM